MNEENTEIVHEAVVETPTEVVAPQPSSETSAGEAEIIPETAPSSSPEGGGPEPIPQAVRTSMRDSAESDINPAENITEIRTPETVTITEVMRPAQSPTLGEYMKSLLPKLREKLAGRTEKRLSKIMELAREKGEIESGDVQKLLRVSDTSATTYLHKLMGRGSLKTSGNPHRPTYSLN